MHHGILPILLFVSYCFAQQIQNIYTTTWDQTSLFAYDKVPDSPISFDEPRNSTGSAIITLNETTVYQAIDGFGATLTDTSAVTLLELKKTNFGKYWELLRRMFDTVDPKNAGMSYLRVSLGASDLSPYAYDFDNIPRDDLLLAFNMNKESNSLAVIRDIRTINPSIKVHVVPWSPPGWMKSDVNATLYGGTFNSKYSSTLALYLLKATLGVELAIGARPYAVAIQNEPDNSNPTYPTCLMSPDQMGQIGLKLRELLNLAGLSSTKIIGFEHNWVNASSYPVELMQNYGSAFAGVAFHCYGGSPSDQAKFTSQFPDKEVYFTECTGTIGSDFWDDMKWWMDNLFIGSLQYGARTALMWNFAAHADGGPLLPNTTSCGGGVTPGCRPIVNIGQGTYSFNQEFYAIAQAQRAVLPDNIWGSEGRRIASTVSGNLNWALRVNAFATPSAGKNRYSLTVLNWYDNASPGPINPVPVTTTINFRGLQANYSFPVGVTTLSWWAPTKGTSAVIADSNVEAKVNISFSVRAPVAARVPVTYGIRAKHSRLHHDH